MSITTCQKVTLISCSVLCISLFLPRMLLPRGKKETGQPEGKSAYQIIIHPSPRLFLLLLLLLLVLPAVALTIKSASGLGPHHSAHVHHNVIQQIRKKNNMHFTLIEEYVCGICSNFFKCTCAHFHMFRPNFFYIFEYMSPLNFTQ